MEDDLMLRTVGTTLACVVLAAGSAHAQSAEDSTAIRATAMDYIEGYYTGDGDRMERALHPKLAKRIVEQGADGSVLHNMTAEQLISGTRRGGGKMTPPERKQMDVSILDIYRSVASVKIIAGDWIDYLHVARFDGRWVIVNVLWEMKPKPEASGG
jgi:hypothetical protein